MKIFLVFLAVWLIIAQPVYSQAKVALLIGNKDYAVSPLKNPVNDAQDMAFALKSLGFDVVLKNNVNDAKGMVSAVNEFTSKMSNQGLFVFYYSGHGIQYNGKNYLVPTGQVINDETDIEFECMDVDRLLSKCESYSNNTNIVILDACRDNPFVSLSRSVSKGLAVVGKSPGGTLIAYSTSPGKTASDGSGRNGLYTQELLKAIKIPGLAIEEAFKEVRKNVQRISGNKQTPWETSSLINSVSFSDPIASTSEDANVINEIRILEQSTKEQEPVTISENRNESSISIGNDKTQFRPEYKHNSFGYGIKAGLNIASMSGLDDTESMYGLAGGIYIRYNITEKISIQPEFLYSQKGVGFYFYDGFTDGYADLNISYLQIPIFGLFEFSKGSTISPFIFAGPAFGLIMTSSLTFEEYGEEEADLSSKEFSFIFGGGVNFNKFSIEARYDLGLTTTDPEGEFAMKNKVIQIILGYSIK